jgi:hypothetical protein
MGLQIKISITPEQGKSEDPDTFDVFCLSLAGPFRQNLYLAAFEKASE